MQNLGAQNSDYFSSISFKESFGCSERTHDMVLFSTRPLDKSVIKKYLLHNQNKQGWGGGGGTRGPDPTWIITSCYTHNFTLKFIVYLYYGEPKTHVWVQSRK